MTAYIDVDSFAGGGGASLGIEAALGKPVDIAINHVPEAIAMHAAKGKPLTKTPQIRMCGNSVCPNAAKALVRANVPGTAVHSSLPRSIATAFASP